RWSPPTGRFRPGPAAALVPRVAERAQLALTSTARSRFSPHVNIRRPQMLAHPRHRVAVATGALRAAPGVGGKQEDANAHNDRKEGADGCDSDTFRTLKAARLGRARFGNERCRLLRIALLELGRDRSQSFARSGLPLRGRSPRQPPASSLPRPVKA